MGSLKRMTDRKKVFLGIFLILVPWVLLTVAVVGLVIELYTAGAVPCEEVFYASTQDIRYECRSSVFQHLPYLIYGVMGVLGMVGILAGNPFGLYLLFSAMAEGNKKGVGSRQ